MYLGFQTAITITSIIKYELSEASAKEKEKFLIGMTVLLTILFALYFCCYPKKFVKLTTSLVGALNLFFGILILKEKSTDGTYQISHKNFSVFIVLGIALVSLLFQSFCLKEDTDKSDKDEAFIKV